MVGVSAETLRKLASGAISKPEDPSTMLIEFRAENHRSIRGELALSMAAVRANDGADPRPRAVPASTDPLLPVAAIYGANASGKSNVLSALSFMRDAVVHSHRSWPPDGGVPRAPFAWGDSRERPSMFELTFVLGGERYEYGFAANSSCFLEEWLYAWPHGRKQVWFERDGQEFKTGEHLRGENRVVAAVTRANALFLSSAAQLQHAQLSPVYRWISRIRVESGGHPAVRQRASAHLARLGLAPQQEQLGLFGNPDSVGREARFIAFLALLRAADVGIRDVKLVQEDGPVRGMGFATRPRVYLQHGEGDDAWLPLEEESHGTQTLFHMAAPLLDVMDRGGVLVVDELEKSLHPLLALQIVRQFNDPTLNPKNAQLLFTTHDTNLLGTVVGEPALRRDQVWLTEKNESGGTELYPLTDYQPRKQENIERGYLQGRYGAIPFLGALVLSAGAS